MNRALAEVMTEKEFQATVIAMFKAHGWLTYHTFDSRKSAAGFPDLVLVSAKHKACIIVELKSMSGELDPAQEEWMAGLDAVEAFINQVWRPTDMQAIESYASGVAIRRMLEGDQ